MTLSPATAGALSAAGLDPAYVAEVARRALEEDLGGGVDVTTVATVPVDQQAFAEFRARADGVLAGAVVAAAVLEVATDRAVAVDRCLSDGAPVRGGDLLLTAAGPTRGLLVAERSALNLLCHLSGVATLTRRWVDAVHGTEAVVLDTRKTTPGLRALEKYAVRCGGGANKRFGLNDAALVKDNHVLAAGGVAAAFRAVRETFPTVEVQVECDTVAQVREALDAGATFLLADNMGEDDLRRTVALAVGRARVEATGGLTLGRAAAVAATGVDYLSVGALTHSAPALDIGLDLRPGPERSR